MILDKIEKLLDEVQNLNAHNAEEIEALRLKYLSKKGEITTLMADFRNVPAEQKKEVGMRINELKQTAIERINALKEQFETTEGDGPAMDLTRSPYPIRLGTRHPLTIVTNEIIDIFSRMGFVLADGPEVEDDLHVFTKMNFAADHPARDMQDTFFVHYFVVAQLCLGLSFKLRFGYFYRNNGGQTFTEVISRDVHLYLFQHLAVFCIFLQRAGQCTPEAGQMSTTFDGVDIINIRVNVFREPGIVHDSYFDRNSLLL